MKSENGMRRRGRAQFGGMRRKEGWRRSVRRRRRRMGEEGSG